MNDYVPIDLEQIGRSIAAAETVCIFFPMLRKTWVLDLRSTPTDPPMTRLMPVARGPEDRIRQLRRMRPHLPKPAQVAIFMWPRQVESLARLGVYDQMIARVSSEGYPALRAACKSVLQELRRLERAELLNVITGETYHTVWARER